MGSEVEFEVPTWNQIYNMLLNLAERIRKAGFKPDIIVGVSRGGWIPARVLSDLLDNPNLANVRAEFYLGVAETKGEPTLTQPVSTTVAGKKVLVVDEVADTGKSLKLVKEHIIEQGATEVEIATVYYKPWSIVKPDYYEKETRCWIIFPWDRKETVTNLIKNCRKGGIKPEMVKSKLIESGMDQCLVDRLIKDALKEEANDGS